ncbi:RNA polymerase II transcription factor SIII subunit A-domain-containing protein [Massariosphaeria phaeospora]|uniref:RNA polymerase II transcription factor SIII subunit A-domain-containing protein n=1 Tax=Massariosphaeria phaeospora TaxID=100035 RepID=A0A7C8IFF4_9PLEO|nr:RNA polymerase II transcription factor SIII subunit A-domain-containing protein [Massariosphaeria phaeospora]
MPVPRLYDLSKQRLLQNVHILTDIGDLPYWFLAPILRHLENPSQLRELEKNCPQLLGETGEIWLKFIKRDIPNWNKKPYEPNDPKNWSKAYRKLKKDAEAEKAQQEETLREQMRAIQQNKAGNQTRIVEARTGYDPRDRKTRGFGRGGGFSTGPAPPAKTGKLAFDKLRRGVHDQKIARPKATHTPNHLLDKRRGQVLQAPARLVRMHENAPATPPTIVVAKHASGLPGDRTGSTNARPKITARPIPREGVAVVGQKVQRPSLPVGQQFTAPRLQAQQSASGGAAPVIMRKRRRAEPSIFHEPKKRKV